MTILLTLGAALALGIVIAIVRNRANKRFRHAELATNDLSLAILGQVPVIATSSREDTDRQAAQIVEAFRTIRMNVRSAIDPTRPLALTITSPGKGDGKSLIASNLALSFAESGARTLLIDGDMSNGELTRTFGLTARQGLAEYLDGAAPIAEVLHRATSHQNLTMMPVSGHGRRAPELLATPRLNQLIAQMASEYDVVVIDSPPLSAGVDAYALATATGNVALVLRAGTTDLETAKARMDVLDTLPVRVVGAVLNGMTLTTTPQ